MAALVIGLLWVWAYHANVPIAVAAWKAAATTYDGVVTLLSVQSDEAPSRLAINPATSMGVENTPLSKLEAAPYSHATAEAAIAATVQARLMTPTPMSMPTQWPENTPVSDAAAPYSHATAEAAIAATVQAKLMTLTPTSMPTQWPENTPVSDAAAPRRRLPGLPVFPTPKPSPTATPMPTSIPTMTPNPSPTNTPSPTPRPGDNLKQVGATQLDAREIEKFVIEFTNNERVKAGLSEFVHDQAISDIARSHSKNMALIGYGHVVNGKDPTDRALEAGYDCRAWTSATSYTYGLAENIFRYPRVKRWSGIGRGGGSYRWSPSEYVENSREMAKLLVDGWMESPGHRSNILNKASRRIGVGVYILVTAERGYIHEEAYATQNFSGCK